MEQNLTPNEIKSYLDGAIVEWRKTRDNASEPAQETIAVHYIDAFQSVRMTLFGETLPMVEFKDYVIVKTSPTRELVTLGNVTMPNRCRCGKFLNGQNHEPHFWRKQLQNNTYYSELVFCDGLLKEQEG